MTRVKPQNRKRASKPKSKLGCQTCKHRHIKCDEQRPFCKKCTRLGYQCEGYDNEVIPAKSTRTRTIHNLRPKPTQLTLVPRGSLLIQGGCSDELEFRYFQLFQDELASSQAHDFETKIWNRTVQQGCKHDAIRQFAIATVALKKASSQSRYSPLASQHRKFALHEYGLALRSLQMTLRVRSDEIGLVMIAAFLTFLLERIYGDADKAVKSVQSALKVVHKRSHIPRSRNENGHSILMTRGLLPPNTTDILDENLSTGVHTIPGNFNLTHVPTIPNHFLDIKIARIQYEQLRWHIFPDYVFTTSKPALTVMSILSSPLSTTISDQHMQDLAISLTQWHHAFSPLLLQATTNQEDLDPSTYISTIILYIQATALQLCIAPLSPQSLPLRNHKASTIAAARTIIIYSRALIAHPHFSRSFVLEIGIIPSLWIVIIQCPDLALKREAIAILRDMEPRVECLWDSKVIADTGELHLADLHNEIDGQSLI